MCGIAGFCDYVEELTGESYLWGTLAKRMAARLKTCGSDSGLTVSAHTAFAQTHFASEKPVQPVCCVRDHVRYTIVCDGELYNAAQLRHELRGLGARFETQGDAEVMLQAYLYFGAHCAEKLNGVYAFAVEDGLRNETFLCRDRLGAKPLFYTEVNGRLVFASEIKALFEYPGVNPAVDREGLCKLLCLGAAQGGQSVFCGIREFLPGTCGFFGREGLHVTPYDFPQDCWKGVSYPERVYRVRVLLEDIVARQMQAETEPCFLMEARLESYIAAALAAEQCRQRGKRLSVYSFGLCGENSCFTPKTAFSGVLEADVQKIACSREELAALLYDAVTVQDLPGTAEADAANLYYFQQIHSQVALCDVCAVQVLNGKTEPQQIFPWVAKEPAPLLKPELAEELCLANCMQEMQTEERADSPETMLGKLRWNLAETLRRLDRCAAASGVKLRAPYADFRLIETATCFLQTQKAGSGGRLLRDVARGLLPDAVLDRVPCLCAEKPACGIIPAEWLSMVLRDPQQPVHRLLSKEIERMLLQGNSGYEKTRLPAFLLQLNFWLRQYDVALLL